MDRTLFTIKPHSIIDVITNSSSELFVGKSQNKKEIEGMIKEIYPNYLNEYCDIESTKELSNEDLNLYVSYFYNNWSNSKQVFNTNLIPGFSKEEMYTYNDKWKEWSFNYGFITDNNRDKVISGIDPDDNIYFLFSIDENPDWDMQEKLENFMTRIHLG